MINVKWHTEEPKESNDYLVTTSIPVIVNMNGTPSSYVNYVTTAHFEVNEGWDIPVLAWTDEWIDPYMDKSEMYISEYDNLKVYVKEFRAGADAEFEDDTGSYPCRIVELVSYRGEPTEPIKNLISDIEDWDYDCTAEFIEDDVCYFVALEKKETKK